MPTRVPHVGRLLLLAFILAAAALLPGCAARTQGGLPPGMAGVAVPNGMEEHLTRLANEGERNWVLHLNEIAVAAMRRGDHELARRALDESILNINAVFGPTPEAARARSIFFAEDVKLFKGDPHERCMAFLYRGILYMQERDWENARAMFRSGMLQDAFAEEEQNRADWAIFDYLIAVCEAQLRRPFYAQQAHSRFQSILADFAERYREVDTTRIPTGPERFPLPAREDNLLVVAQTGEGPRKVRLGRYGQFQGVQRSMSGVPRASLRIGEEGPPQAIPIIDSVYYQAATRGGRAFDAIQGRKVIVKEGSEIIGTAALWSGIFVLDGAGNHDTALVGLGLLGAGIVMTVFAELVQAKADIRQWTGLPDALGVHAASLPAGRTHIEVSTAGSRARAAAILDLPQPGTDLAVVLHFPGNIPSLLAPPDLLIPPNGASEEP